MNSLWSEMDHYWTSGKLCNSVLWECTVCQTGLDLTPQRLCNSEQVSFSLSILAPPLLPPPSPLPFLWHTSKMPPYSTMKTCVHSIFKAFGIVPAEGEASPAAASWEHAPSSASCLTDWNSKSLPGPALAQLLHKTWSSHFLEISACPLILSVPCVLLSSHVLYVF